MKDHISLRSAIHSGKFDRISYFCELEGIGKRGFAFFGGGRFGHLDVASFYRDLEDRLSFHLTWCSPYD